MDNLKRAEKILQELGGYSREENIKYLAAELDAVRAEALEEAASLFAGTRAVGYIQSHGKRTIRYTDVVSKIRALTKEEK